VLSRPLVIALAVGAPAMGAITSTTNLSVAISPREVLILPGIALAPRALAAASPAADGSLGTASRQDRRAQLAFYHIWGMEVLAMGRSRASVMMWVGVGVLIAGFVALLLLLEGQISCPAPGNCSSRILWETTVPGFSLMAIGSGLLIVGAIWRIRRSARGPGSAEG